MQKRFRSIVLGITLAARRLRRERAAADGNQGQLPARAVLVAAVLRREPERLVGGAGTEARVQHLSGRRAADRRFGREVVGRRRHGLGARGAGRRALQPADHRPHQRRVGRQRADGERRQGRGLHQESRVDEGPDDRADRQLHGRLRGAVLPRQVRPQEGRRHDQEHGPGRDHLGDVEQQRRPGRPLGAEHLHARGKGGRQGDLLRQGCRRVRARRAHRARRLREGAAAERRQVPRDLSSRVEMDERASGRSRSR